MTVALSAAFTADEVTALLLRLGGTGSRSILTFEPRHATMDVRDLALSRAADDLAARGVMTDGAIAPDVAAVLQVLQRPTREVTVRLVTPDGIARVSVARRGGWCVCARRSGGRLAVRHLDWQAELSDVSAALLAELPASRPADVEPVGAPLAEMSDCLTDTHDPRLLTDRIRALGASSRAAGLLGAALGTRQAFAEIVYATLSSDHDRITRVPAALAVFYTARGRIIAVPSISPAGQPWTTLKAGSDHVFGQALTQLVELSDDGWGD